MYAQFSGEELIEICQARLAAGMMPDHSGAIAADTRCLAEGEWFIALPGKRYDGHDFVGEAFAEGAIGAIVEERGQYAVSNPQFAILCVRNTRAALERLALNWRRRINPKVIALISVPPSPFLTEYCAVATASLGPCYVIEDFSKLELEILRMDEGVRVLVAQSLFIKMWDAALAGRILTPDVLVVRIDQSKSLSQQWLYATIEAMKPKGALLLASTEQGAALPALRCASEPAQVPLVVSYEPSMVTIVAEPQQGTVFMLKGEASNPLFIPGRGPERLCDAWSGIIAARHAGCDLSAISRDLERLIS